MNQARFKTLCINDDINCLSLVRLVRNKTMIALEAAVMNDHYRSLNQVLFLHYLDFPIVKVLCVFNYSFVFFKLKYIPYLHLTAISFAQIIIKLAN